MSRLAVLATDPIAAAATPPGRSALGIVRLGGDGVWDIAAVACGDMELAKSWQPRLATLVRIHDAAGGVIDEGVLLPWRGPHSSTGEDLIEYIGHGSPAGMALVLERFLELGARPAEPGEFTRRAFLNGKISLDQAESVASYIDAKTDAAARAAIRILLGGLKSRLETIEETLRDSLGLVEMELDFSEEELKVFDRERFVPMVREQITELEHLMTQARAGRYLRDGIHIVIAGATNAGKSTLFNRWVGLERAIVSEIPGTTRDWLDAALSWAGVPVRLVDTAGLRRSDESIEAEGMRRTRALVEQADILLWLVAPPEFSIPEETWLHDPRLVLTRNKADLNPATPEPLIPLLSAEISATTGAGAADLQRLILDRLLRGADPNDSLGLEERHGGCLVSARDALQRCIALSEKNESEEIIASELRQSLDSLVEITGQNSGEDLLDRIFSRFCVGK